MSKFDFFRNGDKKFKGCHLACQHVTWLFSRLCLSIRSFFKCERKYYQSAVTVKRSILFINSFSLVNCHIFGGFNLFRNWLWWNSVFYFKYGNPASKFKLFSFNGNLCFVFRKSEVKKILIFIIKLFKFNPTNENDSLL